MAENILPTKGQVYINADATRRVIPFLVVSNVVRFSPEFTQAPDFAQGHEFQMSWAEFLGTYERLIDANPAITSDADTSVEEGTPVAFDLTADETVTFTITAGDDAALFEITDNVLNFISDPSFASPEDADADNVYELTVTATDAQGLTDSLAMTVTITEAP